MAPLAEAHEGVRRPLSEREIDGHDCNRPIVKPLIQIGAPAGAAVEHHRAFEIIPGRQ
jgi:hypothetical protein